MDLRKALMYWQSLLIHSLSPGLLLSPHNVMESSSAISSPAAQEAASSTASGGDQNSDIVRGVTNTVKFKGGPLGTVNKWKIHDKILSNYKSCSLSCSVITLVVAAGPPPTLV